MHKSTCFKNVSWAVVWDKQLEEQVYHQDIDIVIAGDVISFVGNDYDGKADVTVDGRGWLILPGLINLHSHPSTEPAQKGIREEHAVPAMYMSSLYERSVDFQLDEAGKRAALEVAYAELVTSGVTTLADLSFPFEGWMDIAARSGLRVYLAPGYADARWKVEAGHRLGFDWNETRGRRGFEQALEIIEQARSHSGGLLSGMIYPAQIDTCTEALLRDSVAVSEERGLTITTHIAQSVPEFQEMVGRHGITPVQWADDIGLLNENMTLGHAIFIDEHSWLQWSTRADLDLLARSGTNVAHCPTPFSRYGQTLEDFGRYRRAGVNLAMGTDCSPHNMLEEIRSALILARVASRNTQSVSTADLFHAATVGGARALGREDLGKIVPGGKADLVMVDLGHHSMRPARDPLRSLVYHAAERAVRNVFIAGRKVVEDGRVLTLDRCAALKDLETAQARMMSRVPSHDCAGRSADEVSPLTLRRL